MLALKQALSLVSINTLGGWQPSDETGLEAWYKYQSGITLNGSDVSIWADSSEYGADMVQSTDTEQPAYSGGVLTFVSVDVNNLQTTRQISLTGNFTVGIRCFPTAFNNVIIADNTSINQFFKFTTTSQFRIKIGGTTQNITLDSGTFGDDYLVITRASDVLTLYQNGIAQSTTPTLSGTLEIDAIGVRGLDTNAYAGTIEEIQIYSSSSTSLTAKINDRLSTLQNE
jgi:hypothetical protein